MPFRHGAIHDPGNAALRAAADYGAIKVGHIATPADWFRDWDWPADGDDLGNAGADGTGCCVPAADLRLIQGWLAQKGISWPIPRELVEIRYEMTGGWMRTPETDNGTVTQADAFAWQSAPIVAAGVDWRVRWAVVPPVDVSSALRRGPLLVTLGLTEADADTMAMWHQDAAGEPTIFHRVVAGAERGGLFAVRSWGEDALVAPGRIVAADLMLHVDAPADLRVAGIDWNAVA